MGKWEKLNKEFSDVLDNLSDEDLLRWNERKEAKRRMKQLELQLSKKMQEGLLTFSYHVVNGQSIFSGSDVTLLDSTIVGNVWVVTNILTVSATPGNTQYAMAA
jgi:hypothetical protein